MYIPASALAAGAANTPAKPITNKEYKEAFILKDSMITQSSFAGLWNDPQRLDLPPSLYLCS
jgi:hypothetical protein